MKITINLYQLYLSLEEFYSGANENELRSGNIDLITVQYLYNFVQNK